MKYRALFDQLASLPPGTTSATLTIEALETLVGPLPCAARKRQWWTNSALTAQGRSWLYAGWKVVGHDLEAGTVSLRRVGLTREWTSLPGEP